MESRSQLIKQAFFGIAGIIGGIIILALAGMLGNLHLLTGIIIGGIITIIGLFVMSSGKEAIIGFITTASGILILISKIPILGGLALLLITISGWVLIVAGGYSIIKFIITLSKRA